MREGQREREEYCSATVDEQWVLQKEGPPFCAEPVRPFPSDRTGPATNTHAFFYFTQTINFYPEIINSYTVVFA